MLQKEGFEVVTSSDATSALAQIESIAPDLILLDVMMPKMSGYEVIDQLRDLHLSIPIILLTVKQHTPEELQQLGVADYLRKPFHQQDLLSKIREHLSDRNGNTFHSTTQPPPT